MNKIRFQRGGSSHRPHFRIVLARAQSPRDGKYITLLGYYNPQEKYVSLNQELYKKFIAEGAQPTDGLLRILKRTDVRISEKNIQ